MSKPKVSVIIPAYNYAGYVAAAVQSVLDQTFGDFELIVVDDGSQDNTAEVIDRFDDKRVRYIYQENKGLPGARNTGTRASSGELLAFLDSDDKYHPQKLQKQVEFLDKHPEVGLAYNSRIIVDSNNNPLLLRRAPATVTLKDLVLGYPFAPSDVVMRREWAEKVNLFDESFVLNSEDLNFHIRLLLEGCRFAGIQPALAYRKMHTGRTFRNISGKMETYKRALDTAFKDPRCPSEVLALQDLAYANHYSTWAYQALVQEETEIGQDYLLESTRLNPTLLDNQGQKLLRFFVWSSLGDGGDHKLMLNRVFAQLPLRLSWLSEKENWAISQAHFLRGIRDTMWGRLEQGQEFLTLASQQGAQIDNYLIDLVTDEIVEFEKEFGFDTGQTFLQNLLNFTKETQSSNQVRHLRGKYLINQAFKDYRSGKPTEVPLNIVRAISNDPRHLINRGVLSMLFRSILGTLNRAKTT